MERTAADERLAVERERPIVSRLTRLTARPRRLSMAVMMRAVSVQEDGESLAGQFKKEVPARYWRRQKEDKFAVICSCKQRFKIHVGQVHGCPCGRFFLATEKSVRVAGPYEPEESAVD